MATNLFVGYDLLNPGQNYDRVIQTIKSLGRWYKVQFSLFYLHTELSADAVAQALYAVMDANDKVAVMETSYAVISPLSANDADAINNVWFSAA